jgi:hypothetical protein
MSKRAGLLGEDSTGFSFPESSPRTPERSFSLGTDLYKNTVVCLFLVICAWVRGCFCDQCFHNRLFKNPFTISKIPFFPQNFLATQTVKKIKENSGKFEANVS